MRKIELTEEEYAEFKFQQYSNTIQSILPFKHKAFREDFKAGWFAAKEVYKETV